MFTLTGTILSLGIFNGNLQVQQYPVPVTSGGPVQKNHPLSGDLAKFSLTCSPSCEGPNVLSFERGPVILHVVLNDGTLSLMETDVSHSVYSKPTEVYCSLINLLSLIVVVYSCTWRACSNSYSRAFCGSAQGGFRFDTVGTSLYTVHVCGSFCSCPSCGVVAKFKTRQSIGIVQRALLSAIDVVIVSTKVSTLCVYMTKQAESLSVILWCLCYTIVTVVP